MAEWTNLFDLGECTVKVFDANIVPPQERFSQVMTKGESAQFDGQFGDGPFTIAVSADGVVSLDQWWFTSVAVIAVIPSYPHDMPARMRGSVLGNADATGAAGAANAGINSNLDGSGDGVDSLSFSATDPPTPEPMDMSALTGARDGVFLYLSGGG